MSEFSYNRRDFLKAAGIATSAILANNIPSFSAGQEKKPNIIFILADDLGYGDLSCYGASDMQTPNIDRIASEGMRFTNFYANCPVCSPTRASFLTGRYPDMVGVHGVIRTDKLENWGHLLPEAIMLPDLLKKAGYDTALIGKWHLGIKSPNTPNERGFDHFHGFLGDMMDDYYTHRRGGENYMRLNKTEIDPEGHATDLFTDWAVDYINKRDTSDKPFFMFLTYHTPHFPIQPPEEWVTKVRRRERGINITRAGLVAFIEHMDDGVGKVIAALKERGLSDNTLVIFSSDNGGQLNIGASNGRLKGTKGFMYEGGIRVPMCASWPGKIMAGSRSNHISLTMDLFPTFCEIAGIEIKHEIDGKSILPVLLGQSRTSEDRYLFWMRREGYDFGGQIFYAARYGRYKLMQESPSLPLMLFDLENDPLEQNPLSTRHRMYERLYIALREHINASGSIPWQRKD